MSLTNVTKNITFYGKYYEVKAVKCKVVILQSKKRTQIMYLSI